MVCERCRTALEPYMVACPGCGTRLTGGSPGGRDNDWREQVKSTVERHREKKRREQEARDDDARQLSIFPEDAEVDEEHELARKRRAEIRARVEERVSRRSPMPSRRRVVDAGEIPLGRGNRLAAARELDREPAPQPLDPRTGEFEPISEIATVPEIDPLGPEVGSEPASLVALGLASPGERLLAGFIDVAFVALIQLTLFYLTTHLVAERLGALPQSALGAMAMVGFVLAAGYFLFFWSLSGQTLGKLLSGARVVDRDGNALGFGRASLRLLGAVVAALPLGAGFIGLWTDAERRGWHDRIAGTKVIRG